MKTYMYITDIKIEKHFRISIATVRSDVGSLVKNKHEKPYNIHLFYLPKYNHTSCIMSS
jgi:hypothetical protein